MTTAHVRVLPVALLLVGEACFNPDAPPLGTESTTGSSSDTLVDTSMGPGSSTTIGPMTATVDPDSSSSSDDTTAAGAPEIEITIDGVEIASGDRFELPSEVAVGELGAEVTITVANTGTAVLQLGGVVPLGPDDAHFLVDDGALAFALAPGETSEFVVVFEPTNGGIKETTVALGNDDDDESPFLITFGGHTTANAYRNLAPAVQPSARFNAEMVDLQDGRLLLFGGRDNNGVRLADTWLFDLELGEWTQLDPPSAPSARDAHGMAYVGGGIVVMFGGNSVDGSGSPGFADTWRFDVATQQWAVVMVAASPPPRFQHSLVSTGDAAILHGGRSSGIERADTWRYTDATQTWTNLAVAPSPAYTAAMAFDGNDLITRYGGFQSSAPIDQTWSYTISTDTWAQVPPMGTPGARAVLEGAYFASGLMIVYSGKLNDCCVDPSPGTFAFDPAASTWTAITPPGEPPPRYNYAMAYVEGRNKAILFGGQALNAGAGSSFAETWEYVGPRPL